MAMQNMCKHATYCTDKIASSYLFVFCVRLKTFQPPLVQSKISQNKSSKFRKIGKWATFLTLQHGVNRLCINFIAMNEQAGAS